MYFLKYKSEVFSNFLEWKFLVKRMSDYQLKILRTDNCGYYTSIKFNDYLKAEGSRHELIVPKNPEQNGVTERLNRTLVKSVRSMLTDDQLPHRFWAEPLSTAVFYEKPKLNLSCTWNDTFSSLEWKEAKHKYIESIWMPDYQLKILRKDNGGDYTSRKFSGYIKAEGSRHELIVPKNPEQNGVAERLTEPKSKVFNQC